jgi:hypothetical protein
LDGFVPMTDQDHASARQRAGTGRRVLLLRTFKDPRADIVVLTALAAALTAQDRIVLVGDGQDEAAIARGWELVLGSGPAFGQQVCYVHSAEENWTTAVIREMSMADAIVLHLSPKDMGFPRVSYPRDLGDSFPQDALGASPDAASSAGDEARQALLEHWRVFSQTPLGALPTGAGLLREIAYLVRLDKLSRTIAVTDNRYYHHVSQRITNAFMGIADSFTTSGQFISPRLTALEQQLVHLRGVRGVTFSGPEESAGLAAHFADALRAELARLSGALPVMSQEARAQAVADLPVGRSDSPRRLPPDGELKVVRYTAVEDLLYIPTGEIVEVSRQDIETILSAEACGAGCPNCGASLSEIFFYVTGLEHQDTGGGETLSEAWPNGKCQRCGRKCTPWEGGTLQPW